MLQANGFTDKGPIRSNNQDCFAIDEARGCCVVADGMGGHQAGEIAAQIAVDAVLDLVRDRQRTGWPFGFDPAFSESGNVIRTAIQLANMQVLETAHSTNAYSGMGTTIVAILVSDRGLSVGHVGDSRLYGLGRRGLRRLTEDDSWLASMAARDDGGSFTPSQYQQMRHVLTSAVGIGPRTEVHIAEEPLETGDLLLLTTDGVHGVLDDRRLLGLLAAAGHDVTRAAADIVRAAIAAGSRDNCTAIVGRYLADPS